MKRRLFISRMALLSAGLFTGGFAALARPFGRTKIVKGKVSSGKRGLEGVAVSDGFSVVLTDSDGKYLIDPNPLARFLWVSTPSGYEFNTDNHLSRHYELLEGKQTLDFELKPLTQNDDAHNFIIWADPQVKNKSDVSKMMKTSVPDTRKLIASKGEVPVHGITVGDIVWDNHDLFADYNEAVARMGIPFFQVLGNHDMDYRMGGDETSDKTFSEHYGPTYYSFNRGKAHYVILDDVRYLGVERAYDGYITQAQLDWLAKDLAFVSKDALLIVCLHIPVHNGVKNNSDLYRVLEGFTNVHIMSGHTHYNRNVITNGIFEHNHGTVCGAWWTGAICEDGTPNGYGIYQVKGTALSWHYQSTGKSPEHQLTISANDYDAGKKQIQVNIWNHDPAWATEYWIDGESKGPLEQFEGYDLLAYSTMLGPELPRPRGFAEPKQTGHLFKAIVPNSAKEVRVTASDRFGNKYTDTYNLTS